MFPMWFFIVLIVLICSLLFITRTTEESFVMMSKNSLKKLGFRARSAAEKTVR